MELDIKILSDITEWMYAVLARASNPLPVMHKVSKDMKANVMLNFLSQGRPSWKPLTKQWVERKKRMGYSTRILQMTGELKNSITSTATAKKATVYSDVPYSLYHEKGAPRAHIPQREFLMFPEGRLSTYSEWINNYILNGGG